MSSFSASLTVAENVRVPIAVGAEWRCAVVHVQRAEAVETDLGIDLAHERLDDGGIGDVVAGCIEVARVETETEPRVSTECLDERRKLIDRTADRRARPGGVLHQQPRIAFAVLEDLRHRRDDTLEARVESRAEMRADVKDHAVGLDRNSRVHRRACTAPLTFSASS